VNASTRWFKYDRDYLCVNKSQFVPVIFEPPCTFTFSKHKEILVYFFLYVVNIHTHIEERKHKEYDCSDNVKVCYFALYEYTQLHILSASLTVHVRITLQNFVDNCEWLLVVPWKS
jgi:hypothetical protein